MKPTKNKFWVHESSQVSTRARVGEGTKIWHHSQILEGAEIGKNCTIGHNCFVDSEVKIGQGVKIESNVDLWNLVQLEDYVFIGPSAVFTNDRSPRAKYSKKEFPEYGKWQPINIKEGATIGANATLICPLTVGRWAMIGAGAVVAKDIPDYALVVGNPAKQIGWVCECGNTLRMETNKGTCNVCSRTYTKEGSAIRQA